MVGERDVLVPSNISNAHNVSRCMHRGYGERRAWQYTRQVIVPWSYQLVAKMGKVSPDWVREFAVLAFKQSKGNLGEAVAAVKARVPNWSRDRDVGKFIRYWVKAHSTPGRKSIRIFWTAQEDGRCHGQAVR
jgi:hypothetical protein